MGDDLREEAIEALNEQPRTQREIPSDPHALTLGVGWEEIEFERGEYGPEGKGGIEARFSSGNEFIEVLPVEFTRSGRSQEVVGLSQDIGIEEWGDEVAELPPVGPRTAFCVYLRHQTFSSPDTTFYTYTADAGDALAIAVWISQFATDDQEIERFLEASRGGPSGQSRTDMDRLDSALKDEPDSCFIEGKTTRSHEVTIPFRYAPLFEGFPTNRFNVPCVPETVESLVGVVSHSAWEDHDLTDESFNGSIEQVDPGEYALDQEATAALDGISAQDIGVMKFGK